MKLLETRRTYRRFEQREVAREIIDEILVAARLASSAANRQPLKYVVVSKPADVTEVFSNTRWAGYLPPELGQPKDEEKPVLFIAVVQDETISKSSDTDAGLAIANMTLAAWNHGVGSCIIGACNKPVLSEMFGLSESEKLHTVVAFGYPTHTSRIEDTKSADDIKYYMDEAGDYVVPKRKLEDVVRYL
ncbi:MAG: nitroreductase family protein [Lachnospiraceae bacterium]|nr:nitroreductase family protein [Lachnospiraceae bacterium]